MKSWATRVSCLWTLLVLSATGALACGGGDGGGDGGTDGGGEATSPVGTWLSAAIHVLGETTTCPGEVQLTDDISLSCTTDLYTFEENGSLVQVQITDDLGNPFDWRTEGTWSTDDDLLTVTLTDEGPDAGSLEPIDPPETVVWMWSVSGDTLTIGWTTSVASIEATFERQE